MGKDISKVFQDSDETPEVRMFLEGVLYPISDPEAWAENYGLELLACPCMSCGATLILCRPFATKDGLRGLTTFPCKQCGEVKTPFTYTFK